MIMELLFHNQYFDYCLRLVKKEDSLPTFREHNRLIRHHIHQSFLSTIDEYECSNNDDETTTYTEDDEDSINNSNKVVIFCNIIMVYLIMILIIGGTAIIATEKGIESMMVDIHFD